ncbi:MAG TPA: hypothetical protein DDZ80_27640 [Cyanobacteria bacterium UBA8803]|nr:hypothetical protein [Cyanobacteria bacterium UBA9273]HBL62043.1 hypothetical protein [Cyanobacteria bacterium UBA8803]
MAKKRLTDLLREEVAKSPEPLDEDMQETTTEPQVQQNAEAVEELTMNIQAKPSTRSSTPTKAELEATVTELKAALAEAQNKETTLAELKEAWAEANKREASLQEQITDLQADLQQQKQSVEQLQKELQEIDQLKTELDKAKKAAVQLAQANEKLTQEISTLKKENEALKANEPQPREPKIGRPIQKATDKPTDFAKSSWLL